MKPDRVPVFDKLANEQGFTTGYACDDGAALHFVGSKLNKVVREKQDARALVYRRTKAGLTIETLGGEKA